MIGSSKEKISKNEKISKIKKENSNKKVKLKDKSENFGFDSIRVRLVGIFVLIVFLSSTSIGFLSLNRAKEALISQGENTLISLSNEGSRLTNKYLQSDIETLNAISVLDKVKSMNLDDQLYVLNTQVKRTNFLDIGVVHTDRMTYYTNKDVVNLKERKHIDRIFEGDSSSYDFLISKATKEPVLVFSVPIKVDNKTVAALNARKRGDSLKEIISNSGYGKTGYSYIINSTGDVIGHIDSNLVLSQYNPLNDETKENESLKLAFKDILEKQTGIVEYKYNDEDISAGFMPIEGTDWIFVSAIKTDEFLAPIKETRLRIIRTVIISLMITIPLTFFIGSSITKPIISLSELSKELSNFNISKDVDEELLNKKGEIGFLANSYNVLIQNLRNIINQINNSANSLISSSNELTETSNSLEINALEINKTVEEISKGAEEQANNTEQGSIKVEQLGSLLEDNNENLKRLNLSANSVVSAVNEGLNESEKLENITKDSIKAIEDIQKVILEAQESAENIGKVSLVIQNISQQTNLLALNASIEAARAGEAGRGFTVVAEEIRKLAEESNESTKEINEIVKQLQDNSVESVEAMKNTIKIADLQTKGVNKTKLSYNTISDSIDSTYQIIEELNNSTMKMNEMKDHLIDTLQNLTAIAQENSAATEEATAAITEQSMATSEINKESLSLFDLAEDMKKIIDKFKI